nr:hypothetical protein [uncultured Desulfuromonas sp.]
MSLRIGEQCGIDLAALRIYRSDRIRGQKATDSGKQVTSAEVVQTGLDILFFADKPLGVFFAGDNTIFFTKRFIVGLPDFVLWASNMDLDCI